MALVREARFVVDAIAAGGEREHLEIPRVVRRLVADWLVRAVGTALGKAGALEPVLLLRGAAVVRGSAVRKDRGQARAARVPLSGAAREDGALPGPVEAVLARRVGARHPVLLVGRIERMAADPSLPAAVRVPHDRVLHCPVLVAGEDRPRLGGRKA